MYTDYNEEENENYYADDDNKKFDKEKLKKIAFYVIIGVVVLVIILLLIKGCAKKNTANNNKIAASEKETSLYLNRPDVVLEPGEEFKLTAYLNTENDEEKKLIWNSSHPEVASVNEYGKIKAIGMGETIVKVQYIDKKTNKPYEATCNVIVTSGASKLESISLGPDEISIELGDSILLQVLPTPSDAVVGKIKFESEDKNVVIVNEEGEVSTVAPGKTTVIAKTEDDSISSSMVINVSDTAPTQIDPTSLTIVGLTNGLKPGVTAEVLYNLLPSNTTSKNIKWDTSNSNIATVSDGVVSAHNAGKCYIIATTENGISDRFEITVEPDTVNVSSISLSGSSSVNLKVGGTRMLSYVINPSNATNQNVSFSSSNQNVAVVSTDGLIIAAGEGTAVVTITSEDGNKTANIFVTVTSNSSGSGSGSGSSGSGSSSGGSSNPSGGDSGSGSGSGTSGGDSGSSGSGSGSSSGSSSSSSCNVNSFTIKSNQEGAVTSNFKFENAEPFTKSSPAPALEITKYDSCLKSVKYSLWYNADKDKLNTGSSPAIKDEIVTYPGEIELKPGKNIKTIKNGYYYIKLVVTTKEGNSYYKYYYAKVDTNSSSSGGGSSSKSKNANRLNVSLKSNSCKAIVNKDNSITVSGNYTINAGSNVKKIYHSYVYTSVSKAEAKERCKASLDNNYFNRDTISYYGKNISKIYYYNSNNSKGNKWVIMCFVGVDANGKILDNYTYKYISGISKNSFKCDS